MKMKVFSNSTRAVILGGVFFIIPLVVLILLVTHAMKLTLPLGRHLVETLGISTVFGAATVTVFTIFILLLLCYISGFLLRKGLVHDWGQLAEDKLFLLFPSLQMFKYKILGDKPEADRKGNWKAILLMEDKHYCIAFITSADEKYLSIYIPDAPRLDAGEIRYIAIKDCVYRSISMQSAMKAISSFGRDGNLMDALKTIEP